jgi:Predicted dithiol-disulfide isomerase involved in polyketide biosynthesis
MRNVRIEMIFDPSCPWCFIGKRQLDEAIATRPQFRVEVKGWPFILNPDVSPTGTDRHAYLCRKYGSDARLRRMQAAIEDVGMGLGLTFAFDAIRRTPNTILAHRFLVYADSRGLGERALEAVFGAYFLSGRDIGDAAVLASIGLDIGLDPRSTRVFLSSQSERERVLVCNQRAQRLGINGVPTYVFDRRLIISGAQEPITLARLIDAASQVTAVMDSLPGEPMPPRVSPPPEESFTK